MMYSPNCGGVFFHSVMGLRRKEVKSLEGPVDVLQSRKTVECLRRQPPFFGSPQPEAFAQAGTITKDMQNNCTNDYKTFCGEYGLQSSALNLCMRKAGPSLSPACVQAPVKAGKVSQAEVDKIKAKGRKQLVVHW
jgi:hypothetical protein